MDPRLPRLHDKLLKITANPHRSHSFGEDKHQFRLGPPLAQERMQSFETDLGIALPSTFRAFLTELGATGAAPFYGLLPLEQHELFTMDRKQRRTLHAASPLWNSASTTATSSSTSSRQAAATWSCSASRARSADGSSLATPTDSGAQTSHRPRTSSPGTNSGSTTWQPDGTTEPWNSPRLPRTPRDPARSVTTSRKSCETQLSCPPTRILRCPLSRAARTSRV